MNWIDTRYSSITEEVLLSHPAENVYSKHLLYGVFETCDLTLFWDDSWSKTSLVSHIKPQR